MRTLLTTLLLLAAPVCVFAQAPTISNINSSPTMGGVAQIRWTTSAPATQRAFWDTVSHPSDTDGTQYAFSSSNDTNPDTTYQIRTFPYLTPNTTYYYKVRSSNGGGTTFSSEQQVTTSADGVRTTNLLIIRVNFPDDLTAGPSDATINTQLQEADDYMAEYSFGQHDLTWTIVPGTFTAPQTTSFYKALESTSNARRAEQLAIDVSALAAGAGYATADYFQYVIWVPQLYDWANGGYFSAVNGLSQMHLAIFSANYLVQANLYIFGLGGELRANGCIPDGANPLPCTPDAGGLADPFDLLGQEAFINLNIKHKSGLAWLLPANVPVITTNGTYRVYAHDTETTRDPGRTYGLRMAGYQGTQYWIEYRQTNPSPGVLINWGGLLLLDMVPASGGFSNSPLTSGTFTDPDGKTITFVGTGGTTPQYVDLTIGGLADAPTGGKGMKGKGKGHGKTRIR